MLIYVNKSDFSSVAYSPVGIVWDFIAVEVPDDFSPGGKTYNPDTGEWIPTPPRIPTTEECIFEAEQIKQRLLSEAAAVIAPLQDAIDLGLATTEETEKLTSWKKYRVLLLRVDTAAAPDIDWPARPE